MKTSYYRTCLLLVLLLGFALRFTGLGRGTSDFVLPADETRGLSTAFYHFHPDERMVLLAALEPIDVLDPPFTVYGLLPVYALRAALHVAMPDGDLSRAALDHPGSARRAVMTARVLAALFSCLTLLVAAHLAWRYTDPLAACLAVLFVAVAPGVVQQAHFYIVDGPFSLLSLATVVLVLRAVESGRGTWYAAAGFLIGATAAVKLTGLLLGPLLAFAHVRAHLAGGESPWPERLARPLLTLLNRELWLAGAVAVVTLSCFEPYLVAEPGLIFRSETIEDFANSAEIASGDILRPWTLVDVHTIPYLHHWTHLFPLVVGWPLTLAFLAAVAFALWRRSTPSIIALVWIGLYFGLVGGLHAKHVRYLIPLVPLLSMLTADLLSRLCRRQLGQGHWRQLGVVATVAVAVYSAGYGIAFARIYTAEDSRIRAARYIREELPPGTPVAIESGGFSLAALVSSDDHPLVRLHETRLFGARDYLTCWAAQDLLRRQLASAEYLVFADANRYLQYTAVPELMPVGAEFYARLLDGEMGLDQVAVFANPVRLLGIDFGVERPETSFIGYEHPTVYLMRRRADFDRVWAAWWADLETDPRCPDRSLALAVSLVKSGDLPGATAQIRATSRLHPDARIASFLEAYIHMERRDTGLEQKSLEHYKAAYDDPSHATFMIPWASAMSLIGLDLPYLVTSAMTYGHGRLQARHGRSLAVLAIEAGGALSACGQPEHASTVYELAEKAAPTAETLSALGSAHYDRGDLVASSQAYLKAIELDSTNMMARSNLAWNVYLQGDFEEAIRLNRQLLADGLHEVATLNLALACVAHGDIAEADSLYGWAIGQIGAEAIDRIGGTRDLRDLAHRGPNAAAARRILAKYWPAYIVKP